MAARRQPISVRASIRTALFGVLVAVSVTAIVAHEFLRREDAHRAAHDRTHTVAETIALQLDIRGDAGMAEAQELCRGMLESPSLLAICVWDGEGRRIACEGREPDHARLLEVIHDDPSRSPRADTHFWTSHALSTEFGPLDAEFVAIGTGRIGQRPATLGVLLDMAPMLGGFGEHLTLYYVPVLFVGLLALVAGTLRLHREVVHPIGTLVAAASDHGHDRADAGNLDRHEELGLLAKTLHSLRLDAVTWQRKAELSERRTDTRIAEETRRITRDLQRLQQAAWVDPLTNIYNRRFLEEKLPEVFEAQRATRRDLSVVVFDLDNFKQLNDTQGHAAGDAVLKFVGELLRQCTRQGDFAVRLGGDEFLLVMPGTSTERAKAVAERILSLFGQRTKAMTTVRPTPSVTAGVAGIVTNRPASLCDAIHVADEALLAAKQAGKGRVQVAWAKGLDTASPRNLAGQA